MANYYLDSRTGISGEALREVFRNFGPVQPTVSGKEEHVSYTELRPHPALSGFIHCYWELKTESPLQNPFNYRVVADGCVDVFADVLQPQENFVMGFCSGYTEFPLPRFFHYAGIRFLPGAFPLFFPVNAADLANRSVQLDMVNKACCIFLETMADAFQDAAIFKQKADAFFLPKAHHALLAADPRVLNALALLIGNAGNIPLEHNRETGISSRQLRRLFGHYIGESPKTFGKVVRFQQLLAAKPSVISLKKEKLFFDLGYYDQAHFIKDFKTMFGTTPSQAF
ncbi:helix-turn-helix domain-containing protein [Parasegetibacter sp. NRK P23]|uniref:AraC family transcriptional regulator n=1 Tax=Parasegetibacter sp. NRK P23 TaxID=2942999 RepID=UPI002042DFEF|nr:helix-turn-helix domain-containing protein [Parasegetibacter sp. NRK P23]MCM5528015.1 helix-turn-helix domain-containing protein [Parasegetibacter sp. NRK P23]